MDWKRYANVLLVLLLIIIFMEGIMYYVTNLQKSLWSQSVQNALEVSSQGGHAFAVYLEKEMSMVHKIAKNLSQTNSESVLDAFHIQALVDDETVNYTVVNVTDGIRYSNRNMNGAVTEERLAQYRAYEGSGILEPYLNEYNGQRTLGFYECFTFADGKTGIFQIGDIITDIAKEFSLSFYDNTGFSYIVNKKGDILIRSRHQNSNRTLMNVYDIISGKENDEEKIQQFQTSIESGDRGAAHFNIDDEEYIFAYVPIDYTDGWYMISIIPNSAIIKDTERLLQSVEVFLFVLVVSVLILFMFFFLTRQSHKNVLQKNMEIQYREQLFSILANNTNDIFLMLRAEDFSVEYVSPNVERVLGISQADVKNNLKVLGIPVYYAGQSKTIDYEFLSAMEPETSVVMEGERIHRKTGEKRWYLETVYRMKIGNQNKFIIVISDRTEEKNSRYALEEALEIARVANEAKSTFLSNMSHDIRTPMNAIVGFCTLLRNNADNPERVREYVSKIDSSSQHLLGLINNILDMSKIESGKTTLNLTKITLEEIREDLETIMLPQAEAHQQAFHIELSDEQHESLLGDKLRINQILINLLSNAVKYTPQGGTIKMVISRVPYESDKVAHLRFVVCDNGIGMSEDYLSKIFEPFTREENDSAGEVQGTGLGMAITKSLVDLMGGTITVESKLGSGTEFTVDMKLQIYQEDAVREAESEEVSNQTADASNSKQAEQDIAEMFQELQFLAAEDNELNAEILTEILRMLGSSCDVVGNGQEAVKRFEDSVPGQYDAILMDVKMPVMSGYEATKAIRAGSHPDAKEIPIIAMTANAFTEDIKAAQDCGMNAHIAKPIDLKQFQTTVVRLVRERREKG